MSWTFQYICYNETVNIVLHKRLTECFIIIISILNLVSILTQKHNIIYHHVKSFQQLSSNSEGN